MSNGVGKSINHTNAKTHQHNDPQIPQPDLRFASGEPKQTAKPNKTPQKTGPEPNQNSHKIDLP